MTNLVEEILNEIEQKDPQEIQITFEESYIYRPSMDACYGLDITVFLPAIDGDVIPALRDPNNFLGEKLGPLWGYASNTNNLDDFDRNMGTNCRHKTVFLSSSVSWDDLRIKKEARISEILDYLETVYSNNLKQFRIKPADETRSYLLKGNK